jgi:hypothetical protein
MRLLHALHHLEDLEVYIHLATHAAEHRMHHAGGAMHVIALAHHAVDHRLNLGLGSPLLHDN